MKKRKWQGKIVAELLKNYQKRVTRCRHFLECGGCSMQDFDYKNQLTVKANKVEELVESEMEVEGQKIEIYGGEEWEYRTRMDFVVNKDGMGLRRKRSFDKIVNLEECFLVDNQVLQFCRKVYQAGLQIGLLPYDLKMHTGDWRYLSVRVNENNEVMLILITKKGADEKIEKLVSEILILDNDNKDQIKVVSIYHVINDSLTDVNFGETRKFWGNEYLQYSICDIRYAIKPNTFFQNNISVVNKLVDKIVDNVDKEDAVLDLYCGVGTLSLPVARKCKCVLGVELMPESIELAKKNTKDNGIKNIKFEVGDVTRNVGEYMALIEEGGYNVLLLDPPRNGLDKAVEKIMDYNFEKIIYMSCNPLSLVKDLVALTKKWKIEEISLWDLYPQTPHVECLVVMRKNI